MKQLLSNKLRVVLRIQTVIKIKFYIARVHSYSCSPDWRTTGRSRAVVLTLTIFYLLNHLFLLFLLLKNGCENIKS